MTPIKRFRLGFVDVQNQTAEIVDVSGTKVSVVDGVVLEAQFVVGNGGYLLVTSDEDPFEGCLHMNLRDDRFEKVDGMRLGLPYRAGTFLPRGQGPGESLRFSFFADEIWRLEVAARARLVFSHPFGPARYTSPFYRGHRLTLHS